MDYNFDDNRSYFDDDRGYTDRRNARIAAQKAKQRKKKLFARRATIVGIMLLILCLLIFGISQLFGLMCGGSDESQQVPAPTTETVSKEKDKQQQQAVSVVAYEPKADPEKQGYYSSQNGAVYIYDNAAYELFAGSDSSAKDYADCISEFKKSVGDKITVYNLIAPKPIEFYVPKNLTQTTSQAENIKAIYSSYTEDVVPINCYNELANHADEYIYFKTDHHWTGLGAYYAYKAFCEQTNQKVLDLSVCTENTIEGYEGSLAYCDGSLYENLDTVHYWTFPYNAYGMRTESMGDTPYETSIYYEGATAGTYTYGVFIWGDCALYVEHNDDLKNGKKIAVVKESYGNAMVPYLTANYEQVHVIDFRHFDGNLKSYCEQNGITEVLFVNNILAANTPIQVDRIRELF